MSAANVSPRCRTLFEALCDIAGERILAPYEWRVATAYLKTWQLDYLLSLVFAR